MSTSLDPKPAPRQVPFNKPFQAGHESVYVAEVVATGRIASDGRFTRRCARLLEERFGIRKVLMTPSCTAALEMAGMLGGLEPGDEVILPSFTFVSTATAFVRARARPVFVDIRPDTLNLDESGIERAITPRTKAIVPVHYGGVACEMERILAIARAHGLMVIEDAAQGVNAWYRDRALGSLGHLGAYSFHETKNIACGEGGALCINAPELIDRAEVLRDKGTNRARFFRGEVDKYTWVDTGSSFLPSELACAYLYAQLEAMDVIRARRGAVSQFYFERLKPLEDAGFLRLPRIPEGCRSDHHLFYVLMKDETTRDALMAHLKKNGVSAVFHYVPLHSSPMGMSYGYREGDLPVTEALSARLLRLPNYADLTEEDQAYVVHHVESFFDRSASGPSPGHGLDHILALPRSQGLLHESDPSPLAGHV